MASKLDSYDGMHWTPPTEAEMKIIEARRERSNKISKLMGDYLLKGYKMLGITCAECESILLEDRHHKKYCVACNELDSDADKDNPVTNPDAALSQVREQQQQQLQPTEPSVLTPPVEPEFVDLPLHPDAPTTESPSTSLQRPVITSTVAVPVVTQATDFTQAVAALVRKLNWATQELNKTTSIEYTIQLCNLIKACSDAISSLQRNQALIQ